ncbi:hypothetical protein SOVF_216690 [Spinacia oleracea]|nr:hypothetical protein SOVF_216690 [Spinacia oleracea]
MGFIDNNGYFLLSNDSTFAFGFKPTDDDVTLFLLVIFHQESSTIVWTANRATPVSNSDNFVFDTDGSVSLLSGGKAVWKADTGGKPVSAIELQDSGNLVLFGSDNSTIVWESFRHPTDTLLSNQNFEEGMKLSSNPNKDNLTYVLEIKSGDMVLSAGYKTPQTYWSMKKDTRKIINKDGGVVSSARIESNSWKFYDDSKTFLLQFLVPNTNSNSKNSTWIAVLGSDGFLVFQSIGKGSQMKMPIDQCGLPEPCEAYYACSSNRCQCPTALLSRNCKPGISDQCGNSNDDSVELVTLGDGFSYFALEFAQPSMKTDLVSCQGSCTGNCTCLGLFYEDSSRNCYLFDKIGSFISDTTSNYSVYVKVSKQEGVGGGGSGGSNNKHLPIVITIVILTAVIVASMVYVGYRYYTKKKEVPPGSPQEFSEEDNFLGSLSGMPVRFSYQALLEATDNWQVKLGQGGFGSVYKGKLRDGSLLAVKKLEGVGQGKKEFRAEVSIIGSIHHNHLVKLKGFCTEGSHRLLAYEFMENNSLEKWIFKRDKDNDCLLDWPTRFNIAVGTAKGLAYLHEDCEVKIVHCDIKPENVLLDEHFEAKVSDFGLAKLMTREQSHMMEEGKLLEILDSGMKYGPDKESVGTAIKIALWCIQEDMSMRPPMSKVVQMLEGISPVPMPPTSSLSGARLFSSFFQLSSNDGTGTGSSSAPSDWDCNSVAYQSAVRLSGPR